MNVALPRPHFRRLSWREKERVVPISRRSRIAFKAVLWVVAALVFAGGLLQTSLFRIDRIDVTGNHQLSRDDILSLTKLHTGSSIATLNSQAAERRLESHPWVLHATVQAHWPHVVSVAIVEQRAVAVAQTKNKKWAQLGPDGTVLAVADKPVPKLPAALGVVAPDEVGSLLDASAADEMNVATAMPVSLAPRVVQIQEENKMIRLGLDAGTVVILGDNTEIDQKLLSAASVIAHTDPKTLAELDVSSPRFPVARPTSQSATTTIAPKSGASTTSTTIKKRVTSTTVATSH